MTKRLLGSPAPPPVCGFAAVWPLCESRFILGCRGDDLAILSFMWRMLVPVETRAKAWKPCEVRDIDTGNRVTVAHVQAYAKGVRA